MNRQVALAATMRFSRVFPLVAVAALLAACGDDANGPSNERSVLVSPTTSVIQHVAPNSPVSVSPTVYLSDQDGRAMPGVAVDFQVAGGGSIDNTHAVSDDDGLASSGQWIVGAADGADMVTVRIDGMARATFYARAAAVRARYDLETVGGRPVQSAQRLFFWSDSTVTRSFDSTRVTAVYQRNGDVLTWVDGSCCVVTATMQGDRITVVEVLEEDEVYLRNYGTLTEPPSDPPGPPGPSEIYIADY